MLSRVCLILVGAAFIYYQVNAAEVYFGDLEVENHITMESDKITSLLNMSVQPNGTSANVTISEVVSECFLIGDTTSCNCSDGYSWSNKVCYSSSCCNETTCKQNVSNIEPLCVAKVQVYIYVWVSPSSDNIEEKLKTAFKSLNGYKSLTPTPKSKRTSDYEAVVSIKLNTSVLQGLLTDLDANLSAEVRVETVGMVNIVAPEDNVCYKSSQTLKCRLEEATYSAGWNLIRKGKHLELKDGSVMKLTHPCRDWKNSSCTEVTVNEVTSFESGTYQCRFTLGSVTHTAKAQLNVSLLPEVITMKSDPPVADCSKGPDVNLTLTATIQNSTEDYNVLWQLNGPVLSLSDSKVDLVYSVKANFLCISSRPDENWKVIFRNTKGQTKNESVDILVISNKGTSCPEDQVWPKTPSGATVINQTCEDGKTGYKSRTCKEDGEWEEEFSFCISEKLQKVQDAAEDFKRGVGATQKVAMEIFGSLKNTTKSKSSDDIAEISASINIINIMATASQNITLTEEVFDDFLYSASSLLNNDWENVNSSKRLDMSSQYLRGVEDLVKNIQVNNTLNISHQNLDLKVSSASDSNIVVFNVTVKLDNSTGVLKTVGVRNLMDKLPNSFETTSTAMDSIIIIATLANDSSNISIKMDFPNKQLNLNKPECVFWNTNVSDWSHDGCTVQQRAANHTLCTCKHLTSFTVLMSKTDRSNVVLDTITYVGLAVSICSLLILLIIEALVWSVVVKTDLSYFRHTALVNIAMFLLLADCSFLASLSPKKLSPELCLFFTICKHLFYLATFSWMLCMSVMLIHRLIFVFSPLRKRVFMFISSIVGYACPVLIVGFSYAYSSYTKTEYHQSETCWLVFDGALKGSVFAFFLPLGTVIFTNLFSMAVVIFTLLKSSAPDGQKSDEKETAKSIIKVVVFLTPVFGVTWGIGFFLLILDEDDKAFPFVEYAFTILNSFQGFFVMLTGCFAEPKVRQELLKRMDKGKYDNMKNSTSATNTNTKER